MYVRQKKNDHRWKIGDARRYEEPKKVVNMWVKLNKHWLYNITGIIRSCEVTIKPDRIKVHHNNVTVRRR